MLNNLSILFSCVLLLYVLYAAHRVEHKGTK